MTRQYLIFAFTVAIAQVLVVAFIYFQDSILSLAEGDATEHVSTLPADLGMCSAATSPQTESHGSVAVNCTPAK